MVTMILKFLKKSSTTNTTLMVIIKRGINVNIDEVWNEVSDEAKDLIKCLLTH